MNLFVKTILGISMVMILSTGCGKQSQDVQTPVDGEYNTQIRNVLNDGRIVQDGDTAYYILQEDWSGAEASCLYQRDLSTAQEKKLAGFDDLVFGNLCVDDQWIYYIAKTEDEGATICRISKTGKKEKKLFNWDTISWFIVYQDRFYISGRPSAEEEGGILGLYSSDKEGKDLKCLVQGDICSIYPDGKNLYVQSRQDGRRKEELKEKELEAGIWKVNLDGKEPTQISSQPGYAFTVVDGCFYIADDQLYRVTGDDTREPLLPEGISVFFNTLCVYKNSLLFLETSNEIGGEDIIWRYDIDTGELQQVPAVLEMGGLYVIGESLYQDQLLDKIWTPRVIVPQL